MKIRWRIQNTPFMSGHMHINVWRQNYIARLPYPIKRNMMFEIRRKFRNKYSEKVF